MTEIQYGRRYSRNGTTVWEPSEQIAREMCSGNGWTLIAREVSEPYEVKTLPTNKDAVVMVEEPETTRRWLAWRSREGDWDVITPRGELTVQTDLELLSNGPWKEYVPA